MPTFTYKAIKKGEKESYEGKVEAKDRFDVYAIVRKEGAQILSVKEATTSSEYANKITQFLSRVSESSKIIFMRNLGAMIRAGLTVSRALTVMERQTKNPKFKGILGEMHKDIEEGGDLNSSMNKHLDVFSPLMVAMVKAGEESGSLADSCTIIAEQAERTYELKKKVRGAMIYPGIIITVLLGIGSMMMIFIVPTLSATFETLGSELPTSTQIIISFSNFLVNYTLLTFIGFVGAIALFIAFIRTKNGARLFEAFILRIPVIGTLVKETNSARTGRTLSSLLSSGVHVLHALEITEEVIQNSFYKDVIAEARASVQGGSPIAEVFEKKEFLYPPLVGELIAVGEETGNLPDMLHEVAKFYEGEVDQKTKNMSTIIEPMLMLVVGSAVGYFALAMISPMYSMVENF